jgi:nucleoside-diphosphate-sugar epimerase
MERELLTNASTPVTILRPCAIHGPHSKHAREWWFVKRLLDGRRRIPLAYGGRSRFQTTSVAAIAESVVRAANGKLPAIANVADADSPTVAEIGHTIMGLMGVDAELVGLPDEPYPPVFGATPWSVQRPMMCAAAAGHNATYAQSVPPAIDWLIEVTRDRDWRQVLPQLAAYLCNHFDYEADDRGLTMKGVRPLPR